jgi:hypothetical protein
MIVTCDLIKNVCAVTTYPAHELADTAQKLYKISKNPRQSKHTFYVRQLPPPLTQKIVAFMRKCRKMRWSQGGRRQYGTCGIIKAARSQAHARSRAPTPTCAHTQTRARARTEIRNNYCLYTATMVTQTRLNVHCLSCFITLVAFSSP